MRSSPGLVATTAAALVIAGCPYSGPIALGEPDPALFLPELVGTWVGGDDGGDAGTMLRVTHFAGPEYAIILSGHGEQELARAWLTRLGTALFLNVQGLDDAAGDTAPEYAVVRIELTRDTLKLRWLEEGIAAGIADAAELRARVLERIDDPAIYDEDGVVLVRRTIRPGG